MAGPGSESPQPFDYRIPVTSWPYWVRVRWPNTIATLMMMEREQVAGTHIGR
jgi:hypothetical protein